MHPQALLCKVHSILMSCISWQWSWYICQYAHNKHLNPPPGCLLPLPGWPHGPRPRAADPPPGAAAPLCPAHQLRPRQPRQLQTHQPILHARQGLRGGHNSVIRKSSFFIVCFCNKIKCVITRLLLKSNIWKFRQNEWNKLLLVTSPIFQSNPEHATLCLYSRKDAKNNLKLH